MARAADGAMHLFSDGVVMLPTGEIERRAFKTITYTSSRFAFTMAGEAYVLSICLELFAGDWHSIDEFRDGLPNAFAEIYKHFKFGEGSERATPRFRGAAIGYSEQAQRSVGYTFGNWDGAPFDQPAVPVFIRESETEISPGDCPEVGVFIPWPAPTWTGEDLKRWAVESMTAMRGVTFDHYRDGDQSCNRHSIGCHVQHTSISADKVEDEVIHTWPDPVGQRITIASKASTEPAEASETPRSALSLCAPMGVGYGRFGKEGLIPLGRSGR